ncbi:MAG: hypothetical protein ACRDRV_09275 [Pseudonocardiaceae bacterium]
MAGFEQTHAQLEGVQRQQNDLRRAVDAGELWMEAGVAETAAQRCEQAIRDIDKWLNDARRLTRKRKFGNNHDGNAAAGRFVTAGREVINVMRDAQDVFRNMAETYRAAGRTAAEADAAGAQALRGRAE